MFMAHPDLAYARGSWGPVPNPLRFVALRQWHGQVSLATVCCGWIGHLRIDLRAPHSIGPFVSGGSPRENRLGHVYDLVRDSMPNRGYSGEVP